MFKLHDGPPEIDPQRQEQALWLAGLGVTAVVGGGIGLVNSDWNVPDFDINPPHPHEYVDVGVYQAMVAGESPALQINARINNRFDKFTARCEEFGPKDRGELRRIIAERRRIFERAGVVDNTTWMCRRNVEPGRRGWVFETTPSRPAQLPHRHRPQDRRATK